MTVPALSELAAAASALTSPATTVESAASPPVASGRPGLATPSFGGMVGAGLDQVNQALLVSQRDMQDLATGNVQSLHHVMIRLEESKVAFQLMLQVRNRMLESYQDVMRMQV